MNQSILFPDLQTWSEAQQSVVFPAQQAGAMIECVISLEKLGQLSGVPVLQPQDALSVFIEYRFDIEELAECLIEDEEQNEFDQIEIN